MEGLCCSKCQLHPKLAVSPQRSFVYRLLLLLFLNRRLSLTYQLESILLHGFSLGVVGVNVIYILCRLMSHRGDIYFFIIISAQEETAENMDYPESIFHKANYNADYRYGMERPIKVMDRQVISLEFVTNATSSDQSREEKRKKERERNSVLFFLSLFSLCAWFCL